MLARLSRGAPLRSPRLLGSALPALSVSRVFDQGSCGRGVVEVWLGGCGQYGLLLGGRDSEWASFVNCKKVGAIFPSLCKKGLHLFGHFTPCGACSASCAHDITHAPHPYSTSILHTYISHSTLILLLYKA